MNQQLRDLMIEVLAEQSVASARHEAAAKKAQAEEMPGLALLFAAQSAAQATQARRLVWLMRGKIADSESNARQSFEEQAGHNLALFDQAARNALQAGEKTLAALFEQMLKVEEQAAALWREADALNGRELYVCGICGYARPDGPPQSCPVCSAVPAKFSPVAP